MAMLQNGIISALVGVVVLAAPAFSAESDMALSIGQTKSIKLPGNPSTGYMWSVVESPDAVKVDLSLADDTPRCDMPGCPRATVVTVTAQQAGQGTIKLIYARPWEKDKAPADTHTINVTVK